MGTEDKTPVGADEIRQTIEGLEGWTYDEAARMLIRIWSFEKFVPTMAFIRKLTEIMDQENHHSDLILDGRSRTLTIKVTTFSEDAITRADLRFAKAVESVEY